MNKPDKQQETGELTPLTLKQGPTAQRSCTDICCCLIFLTFQIAVIAVAIYAFKNGDYRKIAQPFDPGTITITITICIYLSFLLMRRECTPTNSDSSH